MGKPNALLPVASSDWFGIPGLETPSAPTRQNRAAAPLATEGNEGNEAPANSSLPSLTSVSTPADVQFSSRTVLINAKPALYQGRTVNVVACAFAGTNKDPNGTEPERPVWLPEDRSGWPECIGVPLSRRVRKTIG